MSSSPRSADSLSPKPLSSFLLGAALAVSLSHAHHESARNGLTAFGWATVAALGGTLVYTLSHWNILVNARLPDRKVWQKAIISGALIAFGLWLIGLSIHSHNWTPAAILPLTLIPWAVKLWRVILHKDVFDNSMERITSLFLLLTCVLLVLPDLSWNTLNSSLNLHLSPLSSSSLIAQVGHPRLLSLLGALNIAAASSLMTAQQRKISGFVYWSIPCAVAAVVLSLLGWVVIQIFDSKLIVNALVDTALPARVSHAAPAVIFGIAFLTLRPKIQIRSTLNIGKGKGQWWQQLGLLSGLAVCLLPSSSIQVSWYDFLTTLLLIAGLSFGSKTLPTHGATYSALSVVEQKEAPHAASGA